MRNKPALGWQLKTRNERDVPLMPALTDVLRAHLGDRTTGAVFCRRRWAAAYRPPWADGAASAERELARRRSAEQLAMSPCDAQSAQVRLVRGLWQDLESVDADRVRTEFIRVARRLGLADYTTPKLLWHMFATALRDARWTR